MSVLVVLPVVAPLAAAALTTVAFRRPRAQRAISVVGLGLATGGALALAAAVEADGIQTVALGGWSAPIGITLVADLAAAVVLCASMITMLAVLIFAIGHPRTREHERVFYPTYLLMTTGVAMAFLAGDLFNLFVAFEVMLTASYVLLTLGAVPAQVRAGMTYIVISLVASALFIATIGFFYAATGTVNLADLALRIGSIPDGVRELLGLLLLVVFGIKAAMFPLAFWLPDSYPTAPSPVTAVFAGLLTKVGVFEIIRTQTLLFPRSGAWTLLAVLAGLTMVVGVLGAIAQRDMKRILSFHIISQVGYMLMGLAFFTVAGIAGALFFLVHQIPVKTSLFLVEGVVQTREGTSNLERIGGLLRGAPLLATGFALAALSLAGLPPFSGFVAKLALVQAGFGLQQWWLVAASLGVSLLTLFSMTKIWNGVFWGEPRAGSGRAPEGRHGVMIGATLGLVGVTLVVAAFAGPIYDLLRDAATGLLEPRPYIEAVGLR